MDHSGDALYFLQNELPGPNEELYLLTFRLFPKLPLELRLMIWRKSFPEARRIRMFANGSDHPRQFKLPIPPIASRINRESHRETLKYYQIVEDVRIVSHGPKWPGNGPILPRREKFGSILWNKNRDIVRGDWDCLWYFTAVSWSAFSSCFPGDKADAFFGNVSTLELNIQFWMIHSFHHVEVQERKMISLGFRL
jgi:hypothetical protein